jgi:sialate O-acetylesterase
MRLLAGILSLAAATAAGVPFVLSNTLGSHMVLQRDRPATIWGFGTPNTVVKTIFRGQTLVSSVGADGVFRQALPATGAGGPYTIGVSASTGESTVLSDVLFGDVFFCSGQSNMQFTLSQAVNASAEIAAANGYPGIRVMSVGDGSTSYTPLSQLASLQLGWTVANSSVIGYGNWSYFSAVCWLFARDVYNGLGGKVPIGAISSNWGGTRIQAWSSPQANAACNSSYAEEHEDWLAAQEGLLESSRVALGGSAEDAITAEELGVSTAAAAPGRLGAGGGPGPNNASVLWNAMVSTDISCLVLRAG